MKKNLISLAVAASVLGGAAVQAGQYVNPQKTGEVLLFPFYNADGKNATNMHVVNTTGEVKAVKIRFVEYKNSDEVLDFNVYLSPQDHFAFGVLADEAGNGAAVITADNSCTVPALGSANGAFPGTAATNADGTVVRRQPFVNYQYANTEDLDSSIERTLTGHVEVIEMGVVTNVTGNGTEADKKTQYATFATHGPTGVPTNCAGLDAAWASGTWGATVNGPKSGLTAPTGGLYGLAYHINVDAAAAFGFEPTAIDDWSGSTIGHTNPGSLKPTLGDGVATVSHLHGLGGDQHLEVTMGKPIEATSLALMTATISNDVMLNSAIGGMTDWVVTFPTKRLHVDKAEASAVVPPFTDNWVGIYKDGAVYKEDQACEPVVIGQWDREEAYTAAENGFSPSPAQVTTKICNEVAVIAMGAAGTASAMSVETGLTNLGFPYVEGWQRFSFGQAMGIGTVGANNAAVFVEGLPAIGFAAYKVNNGAMSYGHAAEHKSSTVYSDAVPAEA